MDRWYAKSIHSCLAVLLIFVIFSAVRTGAAALLSGYARDEIMALDAKAGDASAQANASRVLGVAHFISPGNPDIYEDQARLALLGSARPGIDDAEKKALLEQGLVQIRQALALRPASPYAWAILLRLKHESGEIDAEFRRALERAVTLGPWDPGVQRVVADVGLDVWDTLPGAEQDMVRKDIVRGMEHEAGAMLSIVRPYNDDCRNGNASADCRQ